MIKNICNLLLVYFISIQSACATPTSFDALKGKYFQLELGMTKPQVVRITGIMPSVCDRCSERETYLYSKSVGGGAELFLYKDKLYKISFTDEKISLDEVITYFQGQFGSEGVMTTSTTNLDTLTWMSNNRIVLVNYGSNNKKLVAVHFIDRWLICNETTKKEQSLLQGLSIDPKC